MSGPRKMGLNHPLVMNLFREMWDMDQPGKRNHGGRRGDTTNFNSLRIRIGEPPHVNGYESRLRSATASSPQALSDPQSVLEVSRPTHSYRAAQLQRAPEDFYGYQHGHQRTYPGSWTAGRIGGDGNESDQSEIDHVMVDKSAYRVAALQAHEPVIPSATRAYSPADHVPTNLLSADRDAVEALTGLMMFGGRASTSSGDSASESGADEEAARALKRRRVDSEDANTASTSIPLAVYPTPVTSQPQSHTHSRRVSGGAPAACEPKMAASVKLFHEHRRAIAKMETMFANMFGELAELNNEVDKRVAIIEALSLLEGDGAKARKAQAETELVGFRSRLSQLELSLQSLVEKEHSLTEKAGKVEEAEGAPIESDAVSKAIGSEQGSPSDQGSELASSPATLTGAGCVELVA